MELQIVNSVWRGKMNRPINLYIFESLIKNLTNITKTSYRKEQPEQLVIKFDDGSTMLIFKSGKFRIMGGKIDELTAHCNVISITSKHHHNFPEIILQTMTIVYAYPHRINLPILSQMIKCHFNTECFPAVQIIEFKPIHVNVFATGKVIMCGIKNIDDAINIKNKIDLLILLDKRL